MPLELQIIRASEFIRLGAHGHFDLAASEEALSVLAGACRKRCITRALLDLRALRPGPKPVFTRDDLLALVKKFCEIGFAKEQRLAILYTYDRHHRARFFALLCTMHGWSVRPFNDFEKAVRWLSGGQQLAERPARQAGEKSIRVRTPKTEGHPVMLPIVPRGRPLRAANHPHSP
jgi:hypothetical protein